MKILLNLVLSSVILFAGLSTAYANSSESEHKHGTHHAQEQHKKAHYACPMHPEVTGKDGDSCAKCGMNLTKVEKASCKNKGKDCTSCPNKKKHDKKHHATADTHACPMNPAITGKEGDTCPKCGMDLEPIAADATKTAHKH